MTHACTSHHLPDECEYCGADNVTLYAWHADTWCGECITEDPREPSIPLDQAPRGRPADATYEAPFIWQTPDGTVQRGIAS